MRLAFVWISKARAVVVAGLLACFGTVTTAAGEFSCVPSVRPLAWSEREFTVFIHFGMNTFSALECGEGTEDPRYFNLRQLDARQWVEAIGGADARRYLVDTLNPTGFGQVLAEYTGDGTGRQPVRTYTYGRDPISRRTISGGVMDFYSTDALGSTRFRTGFDPGTHPTVNGRLGELTTQTFNYDAYGQLVGGNPTDTEYAFTGEEWDNDVGAYYLRARWYRPDWGRFLSRDTYEGDLEEPITQNRFLYGAANPVLYVDPSGHENAQTQVSVTGIQGNLQANSGSVVARQGTSKGRRIACDGTYYSAKAAVGEIRISANLKGKGGHHGMQKSLGGKEAQYLAEIATLLHRIFHSLAHKYAQLDPVLKGLPPFNGSADEWKQILKGDQDGKIRAQLRNAHIRAARIIDRLCRYRGTKSFEKLTQLSWDLPAKNVKRQFDPQIISYQ